MSISTEFEENVRSGDVITVRSALTDYLVIDRTFVVFDEALAYASRFLIIVEEHDNEPMEEDSTKWNTEYLNKQKASLMINFSNKRIEHIKKVLRAVFPIQPKLRENTEMVLIHEKPLIKTDIKRSRTGKRTIEENELSLSNSRKNNNRGAVSETPKNTTSNTKQNVGYTNSSSNASRETRTSSAGKTGSKIISESEKASDHTDRETVSEFDYGMALMVGGAAVTTVGIVIAKPIVIGAGIVLIGTGGIFKIKNSR